MSIGSGPMGSAHTEAKNQAIPSILYSLLVELEKTCNLDFPIKSTTASRLHHTAARNTLILHETEQLLSNLRDAEIAVAVVKGHFSAGKCVQQCRCKTDERH